MVAPTFVGAFGVIADATTEINELPLPVGTRSGDLLVVGLIGGWSPGLAECSDSRVTAINLETQNTREAGIYVGTATSSTTPLAIRLLGVADFIGQFAVGACFAFRHTKRHAIRGVENSSLNGEFTTTGLIPALAGDGDGSLCILTQNTGFGGVNPPDWLRTGGVYTQTATVDNTYVRVSVGYSEQAPSPSALTPNVDSSDAWRATVIGYLTASIAPPCRLYPREDQLGVNSGRIRPAPKSQQASPRRAGGYY